MLHFGYHSSPNPPTKCIQYPTTVDSILLTLRTIDTLDNHSRLDQVRPYIQTVGKIIILGSSDGILPRTLNAACKVSPSNTLFGDFHVNIHEPSVIHIINNLGPRGDVTGQVVAFENYNRNVRGHTDTVFNRIPYCMVKLRRVKGFFLYVCLAEMEDFDQLQYPRCVEGPVCTAACLRDLVVNSEMPLDGRSRPSGVW